MIYLPSPVALQARLTSAASTSQPRYHVSYETRPAQSKDDVSMPVGQLSRGLLDDTNLVTIAAAANNNAASIAVFHVCIDNQSAATETVEFVTDDGTSTRVMLQQQLLTGQSFVYEDKAGWQVVGP